MPGSEAIATFPGACSIPGTCTGAAQSCWTRDRDVGYPCCPPPQTSAAEQYQGAFYAFSTGSKNNCTLPVISFCPPKIALVLSKVGVDHWAAAGLDASVLIAAQHQAFSGQLIASRRSEQLLGGGLHCLLLSIASRFYLGPIKNKEFFSKTRC